MYSLVLFGVTFFGIVLNSVDVYSPTKKCVHIVNHSFGIIECKQNEHIHLEKIWLDNENCYMYHRPRRASSIIANISVLECENISKCSVPFKSGNSKYKSINILYQCTACLSVTHGAKLHIVCDRNTLIRIQDVWENYVSACPAFRNTHQNSNTTYYISSKCNGKQTCDITTNKGTFSVYFYCEGHSTTNIINMYTTKSEHSVNTKPVISSISSTTSLLSTVDSTVLSLITSKEISGGLIAGGVVAGLFVLLLPLGIIFYRRRCSNTTKSPRKKFVTRSNPANESEIDVGTDGNPYKNKDSSLYHHYFEVEKDPDIVTPTHNYINTDTMTYDYASGNGSLKDDTYDLKDDTYDNMKQGINVKQHSEGIDLNMYSHLQDTFIDSDENTYNHTIHDRVPSMPENDYSMSRGQISDDDYDVSGNHYRGHHVDGSEAVYN